MRYRLSGFSVRQSLLKVSFISAVFSIVALPVNYNLGGSLRFSDLFILLSFVTLLPRIRIERSYFLLLATMIALLGLSTFVGLLSVGVKNLENIVFLYKFLVPFIPPLVIFALGKEDVKLRVFHKCLFGVFVFLNFWVYAYFYLLLTGIIVGSFRPGFPFSNDFSASDAHLYSSYLATSLVVFNLYWKKLFHFKKLISFLVSAITILSIFLTGSRTGLVLLVLAYLINFFLTFNLKRLFVVSKTTFALALILFSFAMGLIYAIDLNDTFLKLFARALNFDLGGDESSLERIRKLWLSFEQTSHTFYLFGVGLMSNKVTWYDGLIGSINSYMGILGLILCFVFVIFTLYKSWEASRNGVHSTMFIIFWVPFLVYFCANFITEYFLVTRSVLPVSFFLSLIYKDLKGTRIK